MAAVTRVSGVPIKSESCLQDSKIIENIINFLPNQDLINTALVCKLWYNTTQNIKEKRIKLKTNLIACSKLDTFNKTIKKLFKNTIKLDSAYLFCFIIIDINLYALYVNYLLKTSNKKCNNNYIDSSTIPKLLLQKVKDILPRDCENLMLKCVNLVGTDETGFTKDCESYEDNYSIASVLIPKVPGMLTHKFIVETDHFNPNYSELIELKPDEKIKFIILQGFGSDKETEMEYTVDCIAEEQKGFFPYVNLVHTETGLLGKNPNEPNKIEGVAFTGENVHAASVVFPSDDFYCRDREEKILKLKSCNFPCTKDNSIIFIFTSMANNNYQATSDFIFLLNKHFPGTPIIGSDAWEVNGFEHLPLNETTIQSAAVPIIGKEKIPRMRKSSRKISKSFSSSLLKESSLSSSADFATDDDNISVVIVVLCWQ